MNYLGRDGYQMTQSEVDSLPSWHTAGNRPAIGMYRTQSASNHGPAIVSVVKDPQTGTREVFSRVRIVHDCMQDNGTSCEDCRMPDCDHGDDENCRHCCGADKRTSRERELEAI